MTVKIGVIVFASILLLTSSCQKPGTVPYNMVIATDKGFYIRLDYRVPRTNLSNGEEDGHWTFKIDSTAYSAGEWKNGLKVGPWKYDLGHKKSTINFKHHMDSVKNFKISHPDFWANPVSPLPNSLFMMGDSGQSKIDDNKFYVVMAFNKKQIGHTLDSFNKYWNDRMKTKPHSAYDAWIIQSKERKYFLNRYVLQENDEDILVLNLNLEKDETIYEISYKTLNKDTKEDFVKFFEITLTAHHQGFRLFNPFDSVKSVDKVEGDANKTNKVFVSWSEVGYTLTADGLKM